MVTIALTEEEAKIVYIWLMFSVDIIQQASVSTDTEQRAAEVEYIAEKFNMEKNND